MNGKCKQTLELIVHEFGAKFVASAYKVSRQAVEGWLTTFNDPVSKTGDLLRDLVDMDREDLAKRLLTDVCERIGFHPVKNTNVTLHPVQDFLRINMSTLKESGDVQSLAAQVYADGVVSPEEAKRIRYEITQAKAAMQQLDEHFAKFENKEPSA